MGYNTAAGVAAGCVFEGASSKVRSVLVSFIRHANASHGTCLT